jgi:hypothetical protein
MRLSSGDGVRRCRPALSLRGPSGSPWMALLVRGARAVDSVCASGRIRGRSSGPDHLFLTQPVVAGRRRRFPAFMPVVLHATRACAIRPTHRPSRRSSRSCRSSATVCTVAGFADCSRSCGEPVSGSTRHWRCMRRTSIATGAHCSSVVAKEGDGARSGWTTGDGRSSSRGSPRAGRHRHSSTETVFE